MPRIPNIQQQAVLNEYYRQVVATGLHSQVVIMSIPPGGEVGEETHPDNDQMLYLAEGRGRSVLNGQEEPFEAGDLVLVEAGTLHNFIADADAPLKIITFYAPPAHADGTVHKTKAEADAAEE